MASTKLRSASFLPRLLLSTANTVLFLATTTSFIPILLLRTPPTSFGYAMVATSCTTLACSLAGFYSQLTRCCFSTHVSLTLTAMTGQALGLAALLLREERSMELLRSRRSDRETRFLLRVEEVVLLGMLAMSFVVLMLSCLVQRCWVREFEGMEMEKRGMERKRSRKMARVQEEAMVNAEVGMEMKAKELDEKIKGKYGKWDNVDLEK